MPAASIGHSTQCQGHHHGLSGSWHPSLPKLVGAGEPKIFTCALSRDPHLQKRRTLLRPGGCDGAGVLDGPPASSPGHPGSLRGPGRQTLAPWRWAAQLPLCGLREGGLSPVSAHQATLTTRSQCPAAAVHTPRPPSQRHACLKGDGPAGEAGSESNRQAVQPDTGSPAWGAGGENWRPRSRGWPVRAGF